MYRPLGGHSRPSVSALFLAAALACGETQPDAQRVPAVRAAVAANFATAQAELTRRFERETGVPIETSLGATGHLYAQILNGAPYHVFLAADTARPALLEANGAAVPGSRFPYALGRLALYAPGRDPANQQEASLRTGDFVHLAIANPATAPYGAAAREVLQRWGLWEHLESRIVRGENVGQALQFVESGAAEVGFVAASQLAQRPSTDYWILPPDVYHPIRQDAVLLRRGVDHEGALAFLAFLKSEEGHHVISEFGYGVP